jgi:large subunit ribosomal protein L17
VTLGKSGTLHARRLAVAKIGQKDAIAILFKTIAPGFKDRKGGYTRIIKLGPRQSDSAPIAFLEWVDYAIEAETAPVEKAEKPAKAAKPEKTEKPKEEKAEKPAKSSPKPQA